MSHLGIEGLQHGGHHRPRRTHLRSCLAVLAAIAVLVAIGVFTYGKGIDLLKHALAGPADYSGTGYGSVVVVVRKGDTATEIGATLVKAQVVASQDAFTNAARADVRSLRIQVGYYKLHKHMSARSALALLLDPKSRVDHSVTIVEGKRAKEILASVAQDTALSRSQLAAAVADTAGLGLPAYARGDVEGYLYPATYPLGPGETAAGLLRAMVTRFRQEAASLHLLSGAAALHRTPTQVVIVASLVQAEARRAADMPKVARVIYNRLRVGMPLQLDSTLHYAVDSRGVVSTSGKLRKINSPYNTYTRKGLPPTAIDSPGAVALEAALHPAKGQWRYFVTVNLATGKTEFAVTYAQHQRQVAKFQAYCASSSLC